jgi:hypothetical protein
MALPLWAAALAGSQAMNTNAIHARCNRVVMMYLYE